MSNVHIRLHDAYLSQKVFLPNLHGKVKFSYGLSTERYSHTAGPANPWVGVHAELGHNSRFQKETTHTTNGSPHTTAEKKKGRKNSLDFFFF